MARIEMTQKQLVTLAACTATCILGGLEKTAPAHSIFARKVKKVEEAIAELARLNKSELDEEMRELGVKAWTKAMDYIAKNIKGMVEDVPRNVKGVKL